MPEQALYLKWRPALLDDVVGQEHITRTLRNSLKTGRIRHAYLFSGPRGTGKTTTARLLAKAVNCQNENPDIRPCNQCPACLAVNEGRYLDLIEIDAATHTGVDDVRDLRDKIAFSPGEGRYKVYIIDEVHRFTGNAFDALLKTLEEPPDHAIFVLATTEIDKVPATIKSRCLQFEFRRLSVHELADRLQMIADNEGIQVERGALELIARQGTGSARDSISLFDQIVADPQEVITLELAERILGTAGMAAVKDLVAAIVRQDTAEGLLIINSAVDAGADPRQFGQQLVEHLRFVILAQTAGVDMIEASNEERALFTEQARQIPRGALVRTIRAFNEAINNYRGGWQPQLALELALIDSLRPVDDVPEPQPAARPAQRPQAAGAPADALVEVEAAPIEATPPGAPPVVPLSTVREGWVNVQKAALRYNRSVPALMDHCHVRQIDGNRVVVGVNSDVFREKLDAPDKRKALEQALNDVFKVPLRVTVMLMSGDTPPSGEHDAPPAEDHSVNLDDPFFSAAKEFGAKIQRRDSGKS